MKMLKCFFLTKKFYLIDYDEMGWFTIKLKEVKVFDYSYLNPIE